MTEGEIRSGSAMISTADGSFAAYLAGPVQDMPVPAIIVLQEIFGVNRFVRETCDWLAAQGYLALAPDLFWRETPGVQLEEKDRDRAMALMARLEEGIAIQDCAAVSAYARAMPECNGRVGALGYCLGGKIAYLLACEEAVEAGISYYGVGIQNALGAAEGLHVPMLLHVGASDALCPPPALELIVNSLGGRPGVKIETHVGGHAFARTGSSAYVEESATRANRQTLTFLAGHLSTLPGSDPNGASRKENGALR